MIPLLPEHLWSEIYSIDSTYRKLFTSLVLPLIHHYKVYRLKTKLFMIVDSFANETIVTDDFEKPSYLSTHHNFSQSLIIKPKLEMTKSQIERIFNYNFIP